MVVNSVAPKVACLVAVMAALLVLTKADWWAGTMVGPMAAR